MSRPTAIRSCLSGVCVCIQLTLSSVACSDDIDCNQYEVKELEQICSNPNISKHVIDSVSPNGLNYLVDSLGSKPGLYILPPQDYQLSKPLTLAKHQWILPHPTQPPVGKELRTIGLKMGDKFDIGTDEIFRLVQVDYGVSLGGIEIRGEWINDHSPAFQNAGKKVLIYIPDDLQVVIAGSVITGRSDLDSIILSLGQDNDNYDYDYDVAYRYDDYYDYDGYYDYNENEPKPVSGENPGLLFIRNYLRTSGATLAMDIRGRDYYQTMQNNAVILDASPSGHPVTGIQLTGIQQTVIQEGSGLTAMTTNDFVYHSPLPAGSRAVATEHQGGLHFSQNAVYGKAASDKTTEDKHRDLFISEAAKGSWFRLSGNRYNHSTPVGTNSGKHHPSVIVQDEGVNLAADSYHLIDPGDFLNFRHDLGTVIIPAALAMAANQYLPGNGTVAYSALQQRVSFGEDYRLSTPLGNLGYHYWLANAPGCFHQVNILDVTLVPISYLIVVTVNILIPIISIRHARKLTRPIPIQVN